MRSQQRTILYLTDQIVILLRKNKYTRAGGFTRVGYARYTCALYEIVTIVSVLLEMRRELKKCAFRYLRIETCMVMKIISL